MVRNTSIEWTDITWNPGDGCECVSPGCANCYAMRMAGRFSGEGRPYEGLVTIGKNKRAIWNGEARFRPERLRAPFSWKAPRRVFVNSMSDLFFDPFANERIAQVFGVMAAVHRHTYQVLTKRAERLPEWYAWVVEATQKYGFLLPSRYCAKLALEEMVGLDNKQRTADAQRWPLPNLWLGVSVEDVKHGKRRIDYLRQVPAAVRMLSIEPLLQDLGELDLRGIHWVIVGCESGPGARPCRVEWIRSIRDQCKAAGVAFFLKQAKYIDGCRGTRSPISLGPLGSSAKFKQGDIIGAPFLDSVQHLEFPKAAA